MRFVVIHGAGSFGHFEAKAHNLVAGYCAPSALAASPPASAPSVSPLLGLAQTHAQVATLNLVLVNRLIALGLPAVGVSPLAYVSTDVGHASAEAVASLCGAVSSLLRSGLVPVVHGYVGIHSLPSLLLQPTT
jgi:isopentenyl phosphate kinase